jgi:hypothetical protein
MDTNEKLSLLLNAERAALPPSSAAERGWQRLALDLAANVAPLPVATAPLKWGMWLIPKWIVAGFAVGVLGAAVVVPALSARDATPRAVSMPVRTVNPAPAAEMEPVPLSPSPPLAPSSPALTPMRAPAANPSSSGSKPLTFDAELELISRAKAKLDAHEPDRARASLAEHAKRFPKGVFAVERDALEVLARCVERPNAALARQFAQQHPASASLQRLERACGARADTALTPAPKLDFERSSNASNPDGERTDELQAGEQR